MVHNTTEKTELVNNKIIAFNFNYQRVRNFWQDLCISTQRDSLPRNDIIFLK